MAVSRSFTEYVKNKLDNLGTLVNTGKYNNKIISNDPDKGQFAYPRGIVVSWKDDVTQQNVFPGTLYNGIDASGKVYAGAQLVNRGDILLAPGTIENYGILRNAKGANIDLAAMDEAIIPYEDPNNPQAQYKRIQLNPPKASALINHGTIYNDGCIMPATVKLNDNLSFGALSVPGRYPELFNLMNYGTIVNNGTIYMRADLGMVTLLASARLEDGTVICFYSDWSFQMFFPDGGKLTGNYTFYQQMLVFVLNDGVVVEPPEGTATVGDPSYSFPASSGRAVDFTLSADFVADLYGKVNK